MITLRPYQLDAIQKIRAAFAQKFRAPLYVAPTGSGKTSIFAAIAESSEKRGKRVLILCHRIELVDQIVERLQQFNVKPDIIAAGYHRGGVRGIIGKTAARAVSVASVQTLIRRLDQYPIPTLIVADECHHFAAGNTLSQIARHYSAAKLLGVTATPIRGDNRGLASHFDKLIVGPSQQELINAGYLVRTRIFAPEIVDTSGLHIRMGDFRDDESEALIDTPAITGDSLQQYMKHTPYEQGLAFCTSVRHAEHVAEHFRQGGISALSLNGGTDKQIRRMAFNDYREGKILLLTSCDIFSEGVDCPGARVGIMLRPTQPLGLYRQQKGRLSRPSPGKLYSTLLDQVQNCRRPGFELGPDETDDWELTADVMHKNKIKKPPPKICPKCWAANPVRSSSCAECGHVFETKPRQELEQREGELVPVTPEQFARKQARREQGRAQSLEQLQEFAKQRGYHARWAQIIWDARQAKKEKLHA